MYDPNISDEEHLKSAKYNLEHNFFFVGIMEDLDNGIPILCSLLGFAIPSTVPKVNTTIKSKENYPEELIQEIKERNLADIELYRFAKKLYERKYKHLARFLPIPHIFYPKQTKNKKNSRVIKKHRLKKRQNIMIVPALFNPSCLLTSCLNIECTIVEN